MKCPKCFPPFSIPLRKTGWEEPEYKCPVCKPTTYWDVIDGELTQRPPPKAKKEPDKPPYDWLYDEDYWGGAF